MLVAATIVIWLCLVRPRVRLVSLLFNESVLLIVVEPVLLVQLHVSELVDDIGQEHLKEFERGLDDLLHEADLGFGHVSRVSVH